MDKNLPDIDSLFKNALENFTETPPDFVWQAIIQVIPADPSMQSGPGDEQSSG